MEQKKWNLKDFLVGGLLGRGKFGLVYHAMEKKSHTSIALKIMQKESIQNYNMVTQLRREIEIHSRLKHKHIIGMYGYFHDSQYVYVVVELANKGTLFNKLVKEEKTFSERKCARYLFQLASAIGYLHARNVIHRDLKLENILIDDNDNLKICDLGWSVHEVEDSRETLCGTVDYLAPEIVESKKYTNAVDVWCLGILMYEMLYGFPPYHSKTKDEILEKIKKKTIVFREDLREISEEAKDLLGKLMTFEPENRIKVKEIFEHEFIKKHLNEAGEYIEKK